MNKPSISKENLRWFLAILALVIGTVSLTMTLLSRQLESKTETEPTADSQFWVDKEQINVINVLAAGAVVPHGIEEDGSQAFSSLEKVIKNYDMAAVSAHALAGTDLSTAFADRFYPNGFTMCGLAYPEVFSHGKEAVDQAISYWTDSRMRISGINTSTDARNQLRIAEENGVSAVYLSYTDVLTDPLPENEAYLVNLYDDEKTPQFVSKAADLADIVIVSICWKGDQGELPSQREIQIANALADAGASIIIGSSENAVQPVSWIDDTLVFWSLGNLFSQSETTEDRIGALGAVTVTETITGSQRRIELTNPRVDLVYTSETKDGWKTGFLNKTEATEEADTKKLYESYSSIMHRLDDSIRIGGLG